MWQTLTRFGRPTNLNWVNLDADPPIASFSDVGIEDYTVQLRTISDDLRDDALKCDSEGLCCPCLGFSRRVSILDLKASHTEGIG